MPPFPTPITVIMTTAVICGRKMTYSHIEYLYLYLIFCLREGGRGHLLYGYELARFSVTELTINYTVAFI